MLPFKLFDCSCEFGPYRTKVYRAAWTAAQLIEDMDFCGIERALVSHTAMRFDSPVVGNPRLIEELGSIPDNVRTRVEGEPDLNRLAPTWSILPSQTGEMPTVEQFVDQMRAHDVRALRLFQNDHRYFLDSMTWGDQFAFCQERRIPLFIKANIEELIDLLVDFPNLTVVTGTQGFGPLDRYGWPMLEKFPNLYFETSSYLTDGMLEEVCKHFSAARLIFGSGYPENAHGAALFRLVRAEISEQERRAIAGENLTRLLREARL